MQKFSKLTPGEAKMQALEMLHQQTPSKLTDERISQPPTVYFVRRKPEYLKRYLKYGQSDLNAIHQTGQQNLCSQFQHSFVSFDQGNVDTCCLRHSRIIG